MRSGGDLLLLALLGLGWGLHVVLSKALGAQDATEALGFLAVYMLGSATGLIVMALIFSRPFRPDWRQGGFFLVSAFLGYLGPISAELVIAPRIDAGVFALIASLTPIFTVAVAVTVGLDRLSGRLALALAAGMSAAVLMVAPDLSAIRQGATAWTLLALVVPIFYGFDNVYVQARWPRGLDVFQVSAAEGLVALALVLTLGWGWGLRAADVHQAAGQGGLVLGGLVLAALATVWLFFYLVRHCGAVFVSFAGFVSLGTGVACGVLFFGERPGPALVAAAVLTVSALWLLRADARAREAGA